jgi:hypothetical protein
VNTAEIELSLAKYLNFKQKLIVPNLWWGLGLAYEMDLAVITPAGYLWEIEIKISKADMLADKKKRHQHNSELVKQLYFAFPTELLATTDVESLVPEHAGILAINGSHTIQYRKAQISKARKLSVKEIEKLYRLAAMRIWSLKRALLKERKKLTKLKGKK